MADPQALTAALGELERRGLVTEETVSAFEGPSAVHVQPRPRPRCRVRPPSRARRRDRHREAALFLEEVSGEFGEVEAALARHWRGRRRPRSGGRLLRGGRRRRRARLGEGARGRSLSGGAPAGSRVRCRAPGGRSLVGLPLPKQRASTFSMRACSGEESRRPARAGSRRARRRLRSRGCRPSRAGRASWSARGRSLRSAPRRRNTSRPCLLSSTTT